MPILNPPKKIIPCHLSSKAPVKSHVDNPLPTLSLSHLLHSLTTLHYIYLHISPSFSHYIPLIITLATQFCSPSLCEKSNFFNPYTLFFYFFCCLYIVTDGLICFTLSRALHCIIKKIMKIERARGNGVHIRRMTLIKI